MKRGSQRWRVVVDRMDGLDGQLGGVVYPLSLERPADQAGLRLTGAHDGRRDRAEGDACRSDQIAVEVQDHCAIHQRDRLRTPQPQLDKQAARRSGKRPKWIGGQHLVRLQHGAADTLEELVERQASRPPLLADKRHCPVQRPQRGDRVVGRGRRDQIAGHGAAVADLRSTDFPAGPRKRKGTFDQQRRRHDIVVCHQRTKRDLTLCLVQLDASQAGNPLMSMSVRWLRTPRSNSRIKSVPPAINAHRSPCSASSANASDVVVGW